MYHNILLFYAYELWKGFNYIKIFLFIWVSNINSRLINIILVRNLHKFLIILMEISENNLPLKCEFVFPNIQFYTTNTYVFFNKLHRMNHNM